MKLKIWVVEDDPTYQDILISYLALLGHHARGFSSGASCLEHLQDSPDVVILDHNLGKGLKGIDVLRKIKMENKKISVIYLTSEEKVSLVSDVYKNGSEDFIGKDCASLLRLKIQLERILMIKAGRNRQRKRNIVWSSIVLLVLLCSVLAVTVFIKA